MPQARIAFSTLTLLMLLLVLSTGCGGPATQYEVLWVEEEQALFQADTSVNQGDRVRLHRDMMLLHPVSQEALGSVHEELGVGAVMSVQQGLGTLDISGLPRIQAKDQFRVEKAAPDVPDAPIHKIGHVIYVSSGDRELVAETMDTSRLSPGQSVAIGIPRDLIFRPETRIPVAVKMESGIGAEVRSVLPDGHVLLELSNETDSRQVVLGDSVYAYRNQSLRTWFDPPEDGLVEHLLYGRNYQRALRLHDSGNYSEAISLLKDEAGSDPLQAESSYLLGRCYQFVGDYPRAVASFDESLKAAPDASSVLLALAYLHTQFGQPNKAIQTYHDLLRLRPRNSSLWLELGHLYLQTGESGEAIGAYQHALEIEPDNEQAQRQIAVLEQHQPVTDPLF